MPYSRQRQRIAANGRVAVRLSTAQRDLFVRSPHTPRDLSHALRRAPVFKGKLAVRLTRHALESLITAAVREPAEDREDERGLATLVRYLEGLADRFVEPDEHGDSAEVDADVIDDSAMDEGDQRARES